MECHSKIECHPKMECHPKIGPHGSTAAIKKTIRNHTNNGNIYKSNAWCNAFACNPKVQWKQYKRDEYCYIPGRSMLQTSISTGLIAVYIVEVDEYINIRIPE